MGMYTGLRLHCTVKKEYGKLISDIMDIDAEWGDFVDEFPFLESFAILPRANFIPHGVLSYMPNEWDRYPFRIFDESFGRWHFSCSLKITMKKSKNF